MSGLSNEWTEQIAFENPDRGETACTEQMFFTMQGPYGPWPLLTLLLSTLALTLLFDKIRQRRRRRRAQRAATEAVAAAQAAAQAAKFTVSETKSTVADPASTVFHPTAATSVLPRELVALKQQLQREEHSSAPSTPVNIRLNRIMSHIPKVATNAAVSLHEQSSPSPLALSSSSTLHEHGCGSDICATPEVCLELELEAAAAAGVQKLPLHDHIMYICTKCARRDRDSCAAKSTSSVDNKDKSSTSGAPANCRMAAKGPGGASVGGSSIIGDMEDLLVGAIGTGVPSVAQTVLNNLGVEDDLPVSRTASSTPSLSAISEAASTGSANAPKKIKAAVVKSGRRFYKNMQARLANAVLIENVRRDTNRLQQQQQQQQRQLPLIMTLVGSLYQEWQLKHSEINVVPVDCLNNCDRGNVVSFASPGKFTYQFVDLDHNDPEIYDQLLQFAQEYVTSDDGFTKSKQRPTKLRKTLVARIPPLGVPFVNRADD
ncbi:DUF1636-domain-containing protein [Ramicandelaber brevisporus]|nr:DUF1636-domain-containing protein [Ramicandelaber brevisporus]